MTLTRLKKTILKPHNLKPQEQVWGISQAVDSWGSKFMRKLLAWYERRKTVHCVKRVHIQSYHDPHFSHIFPHSDRTRSDTEEIRSISSYSVRMQENAGKMRTRITPNTDSFYAMKRIKWYFHDQIFSKILKKNI